MKKTMVLWIFFIMSFSMAEKITECYVDPDFYTFKDKKQAEICQMDNFKFISDGNEMVSVYQDDKLIAILKVDDNGDSSLSYYAGSGYMGNDKDEHLMFPTQNGKISYVQSGEKQSIRYSFEHPKDKSVRINVIDSHNNGVADFYFLEKYENGSYQAFATFVIIDNQKYLINKKCAWINYQWQAINKNEASSIWSLIADEEKNQACKIMLPPKTEDLKLLEDFP